jgi:hypothetical protein
MAFSPWEGLEALLMTLVDEGLSATQIAERIARETKTDFTPSRNAVIGKAHRLGLRLRNGKRNPTVPRRKRAPPLASLGAAVSPLTEKRRPPQYHSSGWRAAQRKPELPKMPPVAGERLPESKPVPLIGLLDYHCRYPIDEPGGGVVFCGAPKADTTYCAAHMRLCYSATGSSAAARIDRDKKRWA